MAWSDPRACQGQQCALEDKEREGARVIVKQHHDTLRQSDGGNGTNVDELVLGGGGYLPFEVGCPAFT